MDDKSQLRAVLDGLELREYDEIFSRLAHGELSPKEELELRTNKDPEIRRLYELFSPFDAATLNGFERAIEQAMAKQTHHSPPLSSQRPMPERRRTMRPMRRITTILVPLAMAAGLAIVFVLSQKSRPIAEQEPPAPLQFHPLDPEVERTESGGTVLGTGESQQKRRMLPAGFCWPLQLSVEREGKVPEITRPYFVQGTMAEPWNVEFTSKANGRLGLKGACAKLPALSPGHWDLVIISGAEDPRLSASAVSEACKTNPQQHASWRCDSYPISILPPPKESP